ncbi:MAG TPA: hypothetical protein VF139_01880 [Candidatus Polarisedimenticolaceae bacterium]
MPDLAPLTETILETRRRVSPGRSVLVALTGIDGSGKGYVTSRLARLLEEQGVRVATIGIDGWLNLPHVRFDLANPAEHFYRNAIRFDAMFRDLVLPLRDRRSLRVEADFAEETATEFRKHLHAFDNVDVVLLEGIFLLKRELRRHYDLSVWIDCTFETALERAVARRQERLPPEATVEAYRTIYFPAQQCHLLNDAPVAAATCILENDARLAFIRG